MQAQKLRHVPASSVFADNLSQAKDAAAQAGEDTVAAAKTTGGRGHQLRGPKNGDRGHADQAEALARCESNWRGSAYPGGVIMILPARRRRFPFTRTDGANRANLAAPTTSLPATENLR